MIEIIIGSITMVGIIGLAFYAVYKSFEEDKQPTGLQKYYNETTEPEILKMPDPEYKACDDCGVLVSWKKVQKVKGSFMTAYFCDRHQRPYDRIRDGKYYKIHSAVTVEVTEKGKVIKK